ncbi:MAG: glycosyltransferase, partial [Oribacterium sp.]|nr:glycosyltransferase [Oribacterium sp.]
MILMRLPSGLKTSIFRPQGGGESSAEGQRKIRVLQVCVCPAGSYGGVQHFLYDYCSRMNPEKIETEFMYVNVRPKNAAEFGKLLDRSKVYELKVLNIESTVVKYQQMKKKAEEVLKNNKYDVIHINSGHIYIALLMSSLAKKAGIPVRIVHSHSYYVNEKKSTKILGAFLNGFARKQVIRVSTHQFTCSDRAGRSMYGRIEGLPGYRVIKNAIDVGKFRYDPKVRDEVRREMGAKDKRVVITVGNLQPVKNHKFLIDVFGEIKKMGDDA